MAAGPTLRPNEARISEDTASTSTAGCFQNHEPFFSMPKHGNKVTAITTGKQLFEEVAKAIDGAKKFILFTDWQMDYDVELVERGSSDYRGRFSELLAKKVAQGVEVKVLVYDSIEAVTYTHENEVRANLMKLNPRIDEFGKNGAPIKNPAGNLPVEVAVQKPMTGRSVENALFSHHQKSIVVDGTIAFIGGMDITYGRYCDNNFDVVIDPLKRRINDMYNPCISAGRRTTVGEDNITADWAGLPRPSDSTFGVARPGFAKPYYIIGVLKQRVLDLLERGYKIAELEELVEMMQIDEEVRDFLLEKLRKINALLTAISRTLNNYSDAKLEAIKQLTAGHFLTALRTSGGADIQLGKVVVRKLGKALDAVTGAISDFVGSQLNDFSHWFDSSMTDIKDDLETFEQYRKNPDLLVSDAKKLVQDIVDLPSQLIDDFVLEEGCQPRMPWQDVHSMIEGPAAHDVFANFVRRWNVAVKENHANTSMGVSKKTNLDFMIRPLTLEWLGRWGDVKSVFGDTATHGVKGTVSVQVTRSLPGKLLESEAKYAALLPLPGLLGSTAKSAEKGYANNTVAGSKQMDGILEAMIHAIRGAQAYIYIETQFLISDCGKSDNYEDAIATNPLIKELADRIGTHIAKGQGFHAYFVLPVHPEGNLQSGSVAKQHYWALQTIKRGRKSLIWRVCERIARKQLGTGPADEPPESKVRSLVEDGAWRPYLTFLNLRNWGVTALFPRDKKSRERLDSLAPLGQFVVTEQIYVHSKLLIVDDAIAIVGSANCNDRSLNGNGDTEIAAVLVDNDSQVMDLGNGVRVNTRKFARDLRIAIWKKHLGLKISNSGYVVGDAVLQGRGAGQVMHPGRPLPEPRRLEESSAKAAAVNLALPASAKTWTAIQRLASANAATYEKVFQHTPRNGMARFSDTEIGWPKRISRKVLTAHILKRVDLPAGQKQVESAAKGSLRVTDFSTLPPQLNEAYMSGATVNHPYRDADVPLPQKVHCIGADDSSSAGLDAVATLKRGLTGFWLEMPLDFGRKETDSWLKGKLGGIAVAQNDVPVFDPAHAHEPVLT